MSLYREVQGRGEWQVQGSGVWTGEVVEQRKRWPCLHDRELIALFTGGFFLLVIPAIVCLGSVLAWAWMSVFGGWFGYHGSLHGLFFGYMSTKTFVGTGKNQSVVWGVSNRVPIYLLMVVNVYLVYQLCEGFAYLFRVYKRILGGS